MTSQYTDTQVDDIKYNHRDKSMGDVTQWIESTRDLYRRRQKMRNQNQSTTWLRE